ncbi:MAG: hypothetical protein GX256_09045, partial [Fretibacterium sp.]|nr:hypothetical protein [Fretibacterium sp.]
SNVYDLSVLAHMSDLRSPSSLRWQVGLQHARTMAFMVLALSQLFFAFSLRSRTKCLWRVGAFTNPWLVLSLLIGTLVQVCILYIPFLSSVFHVMPLTTSDWSLVVGLSLIPFLVSEALKLVGKPQQEL